MYKFILFLFLSLAFSPLFAAQDYRLGKLESVAEYGLKLKIPRDAVIVPVSPVSIRTLTRGTERFEAVDLKEHWMFKQTLVRWESPTSGSVTIAEMRYGVPKKLTPVLENLILLSDAEKWLSAPDTIQNENDLLLSALYYLGKSGEAPLLKKISRSDNPLIQRFELKDPLSETKNTKLLLTPYLITAGSGVSARYFLITYARPDDVDEKVNDKSLKEADKAAATILCKPPIKSSVVSKPVLSSGKSKVAVRSPEYIRKRDAALAQVSAMKGWSCEEFNHYILMTNSKNRRMLKMLEDELDRCRAVYELYFPSATAFDHIGFVKVFADHAEYTAYIPSGMEKSVGIFMSDKGELAISPASDKADKKTAERMMETVYHEAFHHFCYLASEQGHAASWFNEGCARVFQNIVFRGKRTMIPLEGETLEQWRESVPATEAELKTRLETILRYSQEQFYEPKTALSNYDFSGGLLYFILKSPSFLPAAGYEKIATRYFDALRIQHPDPTAEAWKGIELDTFCKDYLRFWSSKRWQTQAANYMPSLSKE